MDSPLFVQKVSLLSDTVASFDEYPFCLPVIRNFDTLELSKPVSFFVGENGSGKSTLLEAIAIAAGFNPEGGSRNFRFETRRAHAQLFQHLRLTKGLARPRDGFFLRAETFFNVASEIERLDEEPSSAPPITPAYGGVSLHAQSHGESFQALLLNRFRGKGLYVLDEPEAALSPTRQLAALSRIHELVAQQSQFIIATHSPLLMSYPEAEIFLIADGTIRKVKYEETEHFQVTRDFLNRYQSRLRELLAK
ncbi:MAG: AAA family ATPase [Thermoanaerobaculia bacterium]